MSKRNLTVLTDICLVTCIVEKGLADEVVHAAREAGAQGATVFYAKGSGVRERLGVLGVAVDVEKEVINIAVPNDQADRILEKMYLAGNLDTPGRGFIYITELEKAATYIPPEVLERLENTSRKASSGARKHA